MTRDKTKDILYRMMHLALDDSDQTKKYGILIQALHYDIICNKAIIRACIMDSEMPYFLILSLSSSAWCIMRYTIYPCLVSCHFNAIPISPF